MANIDLTTIQIGVVRFVQFFFFVFYVFIGLVYVGAVVLLPLAVFYDLYSILHLLLPGLLAGPIALGLVAGLGYVLFGIPQLLKCVQDAGFHLMELALSNLQELGALARSLRDGAKPAG